MTMDAGVGPREAPAGQPRGRPSEGHGQTGGGLSRRTVLRAGGSLGAGALAGCLGRGAGATATVLSAGSLAVVFNEAVGPAFERETGYGYRGEFHGSNAVMRMVRDGQKRPDAVVSADAGLLRERLGPDIAAWDAVFASNAVVVVYDPGTDLGQALASGRPWYEVLRASEDEVARSDPDLDPLGYRTVQLFELAEAHYDRPGLAADLRDRLVVDPQESHLLAAVETGDRAGAIAYRNMAVDHGLPYRSLPPELNFADPTLAEHYASVSYTTDEGTTITGSPVLYNATVLDSASQPAAGRAFVAFLLEHPDILREHGLVVTDAFPRFSGDVPTEVAG